MKNDRAPSLDFVPTSVGLLRQAVERFGDRDFIVEPDRRLTYGEAERLSRALAKRLILMGVGKGTRVAAKYPNGASWVIIWLAVTRIGGFLMPLNSAYKAGEAKKCVRIGDAQVYLSPMEIVGRDQHAAVEEMIGQQLSESPAPLMIPDLPYLRRIVFTRFGPDDRPEVIDLMAPNDPLDARVPDELLAEIEAEVSPADWMLAIFTSGSTSDPKCVIHTHGAAIRHATAIVDVNEWTRDEKIFAGMPFFWVGGNCYTVLPVMLLGAAILCMERFEPGAALDLMEAEGATRVIGWPGVMNPLLNHPTLPERHIRAFDDPVWNPRVAWMTGLGMSETGSNHTAIYAKDRATPAAAGSVGRPIPFVEHRIVDSDTREPAGDGVPGNIQVRGYCLMAGFYKCEREATFERDGFYDTNDRGYFKDGFLFFVGRDVGLIKTGGNNVSASEVEAVLRKRPGVAEAYVVGLPDDALGQLVGAALVPDGQQPLDIEAIKDELRKELSNYKVPKIMRVLAAGEIPIMNNGKLDFRQLAAKIAGDESAF